MQLRPTDTYMDNFVAPSYSAFTAATIPDVPEDPEEKQWVTSFLLNSTFRATLDNNSRRAFYNFLRRTQFAFLEYGEARRLTIEHLADPSTRQYLNAIGHWERFLSDADRAWELLDRGQRNLFSPNDGSVLQRLRSLYNCTKHLAFGNEPDSPASGAILPAWLTNGGLEAADAKLSFAELVEILADLAKWADAVQDPITMRETIMAAYGISEG